MTQLDLLERTTSQMRNRWKIIAAVLGVLALSGLAAGQAIAAETLSFAPKSGKFPAKVTFTSGAITFDAEGATTSIECSKGTGEGSVTGHKAATMSLTLTGCGAALGTTCSNTSTTGEIKLTSLPIELVYVSKAHHEAGLDINYGESPRQIATWKCEQLGVKQTGFGIRGSIVAALTPVNTETYTHAVKLAHNATTEWLQSPTSFENEAGSVFKSFPELALTSETYREGDMVGELTMKTPTEIGEMEIKA
jgi:hypothetical protein